VEFHTVVDMEVTMEVMEDMVEILMEDSTVKLR
jgi:hypothetical protein